MMAWFNRFLDRMSDFLARRKGMLPLLGLLLIIANLVLEFAAPGSWLASADLLLQLGLITAILGFLLAWAL
jgi:low affinity Fe/Cu permease